MSHDPELDDDDLDEMAEDVEGEDEEEMEGDAAGGWDTGPFLAGLVVGAAVGAGLALLFAPDPGRVTRRRLRRRAEALEGELSERLEDAARSARKELSGRKAELRERIERGIERVEELGR